MALPPVIGRGPGSYPVPGAAAAALANQAHLLTLRLELLPRYLQPVRSDPRSLGPELGGTPVPGQAQGPTDEADLPPEVIAGGLGALRAVLGREAFNAFLRKLAFVTIGPANVLNAAAWASGLFLDPIRYLYERGARVVIPGPPPRPIEGILTPRTAEFINALLAILDTDVAESMRDLKRARIRAWIEGELRAGRLDPNDPRLLETERRLNIRFARPGESQAEQDRRRAIAMLLYLALIAPRLFGDPQDDTLPAAPLGSVDP